MNGMNANRKIPDVCRLLMELSIAVPILVRQVFKKLPAWGGALSIVVFVLAAVVMMVYENRCMGKKGRELWTSNRVVALTGTVLVVLLYAIFLR